MSGVAQVGAFKKMNDGDIGRWLIAVDWLMKNNVQFPTRKDFDFVNLKYGRDFLAEHKQYDIVVMHDIFHANSAELPLMPKLRVPKMVMQAIMLSPKHSVQQWRYRLMNTNAHHIFIFETAPCCLNGWKIGELENRGIGWI
jgi:hypothetical protein